MEIENQKSETQKWLLQYLDRNQFPVQQNRLTLNLDSLRTQNAKCVQSIIKTPAVYHKLVKEWIKGRVQQTEGKKISQYSKEPSIRVSFEGNLGPNFVTPRGLGSKMANQLVGIQGIVTKMSITRNQLTKSIHFCEKTTMISLKDYPDQFAPDEDFDLNKNKTIPLKDINDNPLSFEYGKSTFKNIQHLIIQEAPQNAPTGQLPRNINVVLQDDLVDKVKPGDRVQLIGIFRLHAGNQAKVNAILKPFLLCTSIMPLHQQNTILIQPKLARIPYPQNQLFNLFAQSISPSIYGHQHLKKAVLLMLVGGCEKNLDNGTHLRGDINLLMVGDPGTAKSQILRWVLSTVDLGVATTGSGASGVGLTAAITMDRQTGERNLQAGAMVLADRGFVCIDQFDKMNQVDRVAVHEVMQQQTVTIAKAGIHCSLNARCSVIAAANPIYGEYQKDMAPTKNIGMPDSLLSRFDLIFIILDEKDAQKDKKIAQRVCKNHKYAPIQSNNINQLDDQFIIHPVQIIQKQQLMFEKSSLFKGENRTEILTQGFLKKYVNHCRKNIQPVLTDDSIQLLALLWTTLREKDMLNDNSKQANKVLPITIRSYETLIRLSTAHAKLRLSNTIDVSDCKQAFKLMVHCLYNDENALQKQMNESLVGIEKQNRMEVQSKPTQTTKAKTAVSKQKEVVVKQKKEEVGDITKKMEKIKINEQEEAFKQPKQTKQIKIKQPQTRSKTKEKQLKGAVFKAFHALKSKKRADSTVQLKDLLKAVPQIPEQKVRSILRELDTDNKILFEEDNSIIHEI